MSDDSTPSAKPPERSSAESPPQRLPFRFTGQARDYFRIWVVNMFLSLATLGLWSPWAKVRKRRYLYGHTWLGDANFEYHADPLAILRGRLIAAAAAGLYWIIDTLVPSAAPWLLSALLCGAPWIIAKSLAFNASRSSHRGVHFAFRGSAWDVARIVWPVGLLIVALVWISHHSTEGIYENPLRYGLEIMAVYLSVVAIYPFVVARIRRLTVGKSEWGSQPFASALRARSLYGIYILAALMCILPIVFVSVVAGVLAAALASKLQQSALLAGVGFGLLALVYASVVILWTAYTRSRIGNLVFNTSRLATLAKLNSYMSAKRLAKLYAVNFLAILATAGLLIPWAVVRIARYRLSCMSVEIEGSVNDIASAVIGDVTAIGAEMSEMLDIDLAL